MPKLQPRGALAICGDGLIPGGVCADPYQSFPPPANTARIPVSSVNQGDMSVPFLACMAAAASFYHLPPRVLPSIQAVEGGRPGLIQPDANGTGDLGLMQINSVWIEPLARYTRMTEQAVIDRLLNDPCFSIAASAAIMRLYLTEAHGNVMVAIGYYHSHTPALSAAYQQKVLDAAGMLFSGTRNQRR